jgi:hypothetical protein
MYDVRSHAGKSAGRALLNTIPQNSHLCRISARFAGDIKYGTLRVLGSCIKVADNTESSGLWWMAV